MAGVLRIDAPYSRDSRARRVEKAAERRRDGRSIQPRACSVCGETAVFNVGRPDVRKAIREGSQLCENCAGGETLDTGRRGPERFVRTVEDWQKMRNRQGYEKSREKQNRKGESR